MAVHLQIYLDTTENKLVNGPNDPTPYVLPKQFFEAEIDLEVTLLRRKEGGGFTEPFEYLGNAEPLAVAIGSWSGVTGTKLAYQNTWNTATTNKYRGTLNLNTSEMVTALTGNQTISKTFEIEWGGGQTFQQSVVVSGEVITAGSPDPSDYTDTEFANAMWARLVDGDTIDFQRTGDDISAEVIKKTDGGLAADANGLYLDDWTSVTETTLVASDAKTLSAGAKYRVLIGNYSMNGATADGSATLDLSTTDREDGDRAIVHFNASTISYDVEVTVDSTAQLVFETDSTNPLSLTALFYFSSGTWNLISARWEDGTLAAGDFTPTYPSSPTLTDETEITVSYPSATGSTDYDPDDEKTHSVLKIAPTAGTGAYTYDYIIQQPGGSGEPAPIIAVLVEMPASNNPTIRIYDEGPTAGSGDDVLLATFKGTALGTRNHTLLLVWDGGAYSTLLDDSHAVALGYHPIYVPATAMTTRSTNGATAASEETSTTKTMLETMSFAGDVDRYVQFHTDTPGGWDLGDVLVQFVWLPKESGSTGDVVWAAYGKCVGDNEDPDTAFGSAAQVVDTVQTVDNIHRTAWINGLTVAGAAAGETLFVQLERQVTDVLDTIHDGASGAVACDLLGVRLLFKLDSLNDDISARSDP